MYMDIYREREYCLYKYIHIYIYMYLYDVYIYGVNDCRSK